MFLFLSLLTILNLFHPKVSVKDAWVRPAGTGMNSALYFTVENHTEKTDVLYKVSSSVAWAVQLHKTVSKDGLMEMVHIKSLRIAGRQSIKFAPGGYHVMLIKLKKDLKPGSSIHFTFFFKKAGKVKVTAVVKRP